MGNTRHVSRLYVIGHVRWDDSAQYTDLLAPAKCGSDFKSVLQEHMIRIKFMGACEFELKWMPQNAFDDKSISARVMAWYVITCASVDLDLCRHMASLGHNVLTILVLY